MSEIEQALVKLIDERIEKAFEERIPEIVRALAVRKVEPELPAYVDAIEIAKMLGEDVSTRENIRKAKRHVYNLAAKKLIPSIRISERNIKFDPVKVREALETKER